LPNSLKLDNTALSLHMQVRLSTQAYSPPSETNLVCGH